MRKPTLLITSLAALLVLGGCQSRLTGDTYSRDEARAVQTVRMGTIESLRPVQIEGTKTPIGAGAGAVVGGIGGSTLGGGRGSTVLAVVGAVAGGLLGAAAEEGLTRTQAWKSPCVKMTAPCVPTCRKSSRTRCFVSVSAYAS